MAIRVTLYVQDGCGYCVAAKKLVIQMTADEIGPVVVTTKQVSEMHDADRARVIHKDAGLLNFVPIILINDVCIGGYTELKQWYETNRPLQVCPQCQEAFRGKRDT